MESKHSIVLVTHGKDILNIPSPIIAPSYLVPVDIREEEHPTLGRAGPGWRGRRDRRLGHPGQGDVPGSVQVKLAAGGAHEQGAGLGGPQQRVLQGPDEVVPEQLRDLTAHLLVGQVEADARLAHGAGQALFVLIRLRGPEELPYLFTRDSAH